MNRILKITGTSGHVDFYCHDETIRGESEFHATSPHGIDGFIVYVSTLKHENGTKLTTAEQKKLMKLCSQDKAIQRTVIDWVL